MLTAAHSGPYVEGISEGFWQGRQLWASCTLVAATGSLTVTRVFLVTIQLCNLGQASLVLQCSATTQPGPTGAGFLPPAAADCTE